eukprot:CAMPEP_0197633674 /NCGR_PEP_ID=MMETSP1338-20131121/9989_1 /TAXON_ID=43686 ORGANISM="Pelagodinium beii, Strain RCC1491" /NCGR_SAMPLE_ID=MMETSP1338 /ASSEMBLY_ACC=CAM_ASM_000754 /LENGTH=97 /DNA_ID=CAMNT_0043205385 /DNA_START=243 /DNA_END=533 /DNA_ORIENTATION=+
MTTLTSPSVTSTGFSSCTFLCTLALVTSTSTLLCGSSFSLANVAWLSLASAHGTSRSAKRSLSAAILRRDGNPSKRPSKRRRSFEETEENYVGTEFL